MWSRRRQSAWVSAAMVFLLLAGGCSDPTTPPDSPPSAAVATLGPLLPPATSGADLAVDQGLAAALDQEFSSDEYADLRSVIVLAQGRTAYERYFQSAATDYHQVFSVTKSVISALIGIAIAEGAIRGVEATLAELLPEHAKDMTPAGAGTTLEQVLTMMGGFNDDWPGPDDPDWVADILGKQTSDPGSAWMYSSNSGHLASAILAQATRTPVLEYARAKLFDPLGIPSTPAAQLAVNEPGAFDGPGFGWAVDPQGINLGGYGLRLRAQDMAKLGLLYLADGLWQGEQVVPADWVHRATTQQADTTDAGYGYLWRVRLRWGTAVRGPGQRGAADTSSFPPVSLWSCTRCGPIPRPASLNNPSPRRSTPPPAPSSHPTTWRDPPSSQRGPRQREFHGPGSGSRRGCSRDVPMPHRRWRSTR